MEHPTRSYIIAFPNDTYNRGCGFEVSINAATHYATREEADRVASQLRGATVYESPFKPHDRVKSVGVRWVTTNHPRPTEGQLATLTVLLNTLRDEARVEHKLEGDATNPDARAIFAHGRFAKRRARRRPVRGAASRRVRRVDGGRDGAVGAHHHEAVREPRELVHHGALGGVRRGEDGVQRGDDGHAQVAPRFLDDPRNGLSELLLRQRPSGKRTLPLRGYWTGRR